MTEDMFDAHRARVQRATSSTEKAAALVAYVCMHARFRGVDDDEAEAIGMRDLPAAELADIRGALTLMWSVQTGGAPAPDGNVWSLACQVAANSDFDEAMWRRTADAAATRQRASEAQRPEDDPGWL
ncbi:hypothetical protein [Mycobacterium sp. E740]|uniref:hypothetical protein n=1 Tax=Mycobacterium sp. E740 TaxID=1834149 RepID=UPI0007FB8F7F|nr:hypothetical protein [Mycobacterium sp. E740]OBI78207.1 hypothetical protein A5663_20850 [Mycobacterium sp. E740]